MIRDVLVDTGPLIALIDRRDRHHEWVRARFGEIVPPLATCEAVLAEACHLARRLPGGVPALLELFERSACVLTFALEPNLNHVSARMRHYLDLPCSRAAPATRTLIAHAAWVLVGQVPWPCRAILE